MARFNGGPMIMAARFGVILLLGTVAPRYAQEQHEQETRPPQPVQHEQEARPQQQKKQTSPPQKQQAGNQQRPQHQATPAKPQQTSPGMQGQHRQAQQPGKGPQARHQQPQQPAAGSQGQHRQPQSSQQGHKLQPAKGSQGQPGQANRASSHGQQVSKAQQPAVWQQHRAHNFQAEHRTWQQRGGYNGYRIPQARFNGYFGRNHGFRISTYSLVMYGGYPRFQYNGLWFSIYDPWPENWSDDWYRNDDVYIDYSNGGYYMYNRNYPGVGLALSVSLN